MPGFERAQVFSFEGYTTRVASWVAQAGSYFLQATNLLGATNSAAAVLTVVAPSISQAVILPDGHFGLVANGLPGTTCAIRSSPAVTGPWTVRSQARHAGTALAIFHII